MGIEVLLQLPAAMCGERSALVAERYEETFESWSLHAQWAGAGLRERRPRSVAFLGLNGPAFSLAVFACAYAGLPLTPLNYRLADEQVHELIGALDAPLVVTDPDMAARLPAGVAMMTTPEFLQMAGTVHDTSAHAGNPNPAAIMLFTSGTTSAPKGVLLKHDHLASYVLQTVEPATAGPEECALVCVPPYHVAGVASVLSNAYAGRRVVFLPNFDPAEWLAVVRRERVTSAMVVPTMLARIVEHLDGSAADVPSLRTISYGGARLAPAVLEQALAAFPTAGFVNAYGLTETSSTITVLGPADHRAAFDSDDPLVRMRLGSAGRAVPGVELRITDEDGLPCGPGVAGALWVRGPQVSGEYLGHGSALDPDGWFDTRDRASIDADGYVYIEGRTDDTIIRGGENIAPSEIEAVLLTHPAIADAAVIGLPDEQWGQRIAAVVVARPHHEIDTEAVVAYVRSRLRGSKTPESITVWDELPYNPLGKLIRRDVLAQLTQAIETGN
ncbi:AMP-binding protein [Nocardioides sp. BP30]|uniref:class I adenylate-forming enzyme family protein n=1 Tax=Nocardioides sp. BP30 TaxID=3036374 RepID=UPI0024684F9C|nr:AMP-binding protein [Nocardioides sp. BP30]WGL54148.1 AMP-binding protein [Nocardioides sp. BP30]